MPDHLLEGAADLEGLIQECLGSSNVNFFT